MKSEVRTVNRIRDRTKKVLDVTTQLWYTKYRR